jgi:protein phosphatase
MDVVSQAQTHKGLIRTINEDACLALPESGVWVVADGMGGHEAGDYASQVVVDTINRKVNNRPADDIKIDELIAALEEANQFLYQYGKEQLKGKIAGSTVVVLLINDHKYYWLWVGDSRGYLLRNNTLSRATSDHSQVADWVIQGIMTETEAENHHQANVLTRAIGAEPDVEIGVRDGVCHQGDVLLICSDGLTKELPDSEIASYLSQANLWEGVKAMMYSTLVAGAKDNVTFVTVEVKSAKKRDAFAIPIENTIPLLDKKIFRWD